MRLVKANTDGSFSLISFTGAKLPRYGILSHTWETDDQEVTYQDMVQNRGQTKSGYKKIQFCALQARKHGLEYFWIDSCSIDRSSSAELSEAINSMYRWYKNAAKCYVYFSDVSADEHSQSDQLLWETAFCQSRWFTRGWTLQELIAPISVEFFSQEGVRLGDKLSLQSQIQRVTGIPIEILQGDPLSHIKVDKRISWIANRETMIEEDIVYSLLGICGVHMASIYGEGPISALRRLALEIEHVQRGKPTCFDL
jgi:hypothetical protein